MNDETKVWLITGAGRGLGVDIARPRSPRVTSSSLRVVTLTRSRPQSATTKTC